MTLTIATPELHQVFNSFDDHGIFFDLSRLTGESNHSYKQRMLDVMAHRAGSTYQGLIYGITRELGLSLYEAMTVSCLKDANDDYLLTNPAIVFDGSSCYLYSDFDPSVRTVLLEIDLFDKSSSNYFLGGLIDTINATGYFLATISSEADAWSRSMCIFNQSNTETIVSESLDTSANKLKLLNDDIVKGSLGLESSTLTYRKNTAAEVLKTGDYHVDLSSGLVTMRGLGSPIDRIRYRYRKSPFTFLARPVIIGNLQQGPLREKLFERVEDELDNEFDGMISLFGLDVINELYSVSPIFWGV